MHSEEPSLLNHLDQIRSVNIPEGGLTNLLICVKLSHDKEVEQAMQLHRYKAPTILIEDKFIHEVGK